MPTIDVGDLLPDLGVTTTSNTTGALADPTTLTLTLSLPDGSTRVGTYPAVGGDTLTITRASVGAFATTYVTAAAGRYTARWVAVGSGADGARTDAWDVSGVDDIGIVSLTELRGFLRKSETASDEELRRFALLSTELAEEYLGRTLRRRTVVETYDGGRCEIPLLTTPVLAITSVTVSGATVDPTQYRPDLVAGILTHRGAGFGGGRLDVVVTYTAGPTRSLARYGQGVREIARHVWDTQRGGSQLPRQGGAGDDWVSSMGYSVPHRVMEMLGRRAPGIA